MDMTREERSWVLYDIGNSAFVLIMVTAIMPIFFKEYAASGIPAVESTANWGFANAAASTILAILAPVLGSLADYRHHKKRFFLFFVAFGVLFTLALSLVGAGQWLLCLALFVLARVGWSGADIFYDAFLTDITVPARMDRISARGYAYGYIGSVVPFAVIIGLLLWAGMADGLPVAATRIGFVVVAVWWLAFSLPLVRNVHQVYFLPATRQPIRDSYQRLLATGEKIRHHRQAALFLLAYFFYIDGVGTVISMAAAYGHDLGFSVPLLIAVLLVTQILAFPFALLFGRLAAKYSTRIMLLAGILVYCLVVGIAFLLPFIADPQTKVVLFWAISFLVASAMGGIQALSRSFFGRLIPPQQSAEFFGFYHIFGKFAVIVGPLLMGVIGRISGDSRWGILSILLLFFIGAVLLLQVGDPPEDISSKPPVTP